MSPRAKGIFEVVGGMFRVTTIENNGMQTRIGFLTGHVPVMCWKLHVRAVVIVAVILPADLYRHFIGISRAYFDRRGHYHLICPDAGVLTSTVMSGLNRQPFFTIDAFFKHYTGLLTREGACYRHIHRHWLTGIISSASYRDSILPAWHRQHRHKILVLQNPLIAAFTY